MSKWQICDPPYNVSYGEVLRHIEDNLSGGHIEGVHALVGPEFFDASHQKVKEAYERWQSAQR